jgi:hypothetical protein
MMRASLLAVPLSLSLSILKVHSKRDIDPFWREDGTWCCCPNQ